jgi:hypothetical protein
MLAGAHRSWIETTKNRYWTRLERRHRTRCHASRPELHAIHFTVFDATEHERHGYLFGFELGEFVRLYSSVLEPVFSSVMLYTSINAAYMPRIEAQAPSRLLILLNAPS